jgi:outer membrane protein assembly factor BamD
MFQKNILWVFALVLISTISCSKFEKVRKLTSNDEKYKAAVAYYKAGKFDKASILFEETLPFLKGSTELEMASYYQAYCDFNTQNYQTASQRFKTFAETFARSEYAEEAIYQSAYALYKDAPAYNLDQTSSTTASEALQAFINSYPQSKYAEEATKILLELRLKLETKAFEKAKLYYKTSPSNMANFRAAVIAITNFERDFPDSKYMEEMKYLKVLSQYNYAFNSFENKKKERYAEAKKFYLEMVDTYSGSSFLKKLEDNFDATNKELARLEKLEQEEKKRKEEEEAKKTGKIPGASN